MTDIVERIEDALGHDTFWDTDAPPLLKDAVSEIKRLRLTAEEREAIEDARGCLADHDAREGAIDEALRKLLERLK
jgi:hypothetical protein